MTDHPCESRNYEQSPMHVRFILAKVRESSFASARVNVSADTGLASFMSII